MNRNRNIFILVASLFLAVSLCFGVSTIRSAILRACKIDGGAVSSPVWTDSNGYLVTATSGANIHQQFANASGCTTGGTAWVGCNTTITFAQPFVDNNYIPVCSGVGAHATGGGIIGKLFINSISRTDAQHMIVVTGNSGSDTDISFTTINCVAYHP